MDYRHSFIDVLRVSRDTIQFIRDNDIPYHVFMWSIFVVLTLEALLFGLLIAFAVAFVIY